MCPFPLGLVVFLKFDLLHYQSFFVCKKMNCSINLHRKKTLQIEGTNDSSCLSKYSSTCQEYFTDNYLKYFIKKQVRRSPLIHIGYCVRSSIVNSVIYEFIKKINGSQSQIVSVGAGFDTLFFRYKDKSECEKLIFYEIDLPRVVDKKIKCIQLSDCLEEAIGHYEVSGSILSSKKYYLIAADLRNLLSVELLLKECGIDLSLPTLFLSECAITYLEEASSTEFIKWAASFPNSTFVTYEQIHPDDGFGVVMLKHFETVGSPLMSVRKYPTLEDQENRYRNNGWSNCQSISAYDAYIKMVSWQERLRVFLLEPFDEWEELYLKCVHYTLSVSSQGCLANWLTLYNKKPKKYFNKKRKNIDWELVKVNHLNLYGHCTISSNFNNTEELLVIGGFGCKEESAHARSKSLSRIRQNIDENNGILFESEVVNKDINFDSMFATCCKVRSIDSVTSFIVYGGRTSPKQYTNIFPVLVEVSDSYKVNCESLVDICNVQPRWRHSAVVAKQAGIDVFLVFGGRNCQLEVLKDSWKIILVNEKEQRKICISDDDSNGPCERFSHSAAVRENPEYDDVYISGGLDKSLTPLSDLWKLDLRTEKWSKVVTEGMLPRYGHTSHIVNTSLVLVGGVNTMDELQPGVGVVDLLTGTCMEYSFPQLSPEKPIMLINHSSDLSKDKSIIRTFGGGGNCFSFGTFFNSFSVNIPLNQFSIGV